MNRRFFLQTSILSAAGLALAPNFAFAANGMVGKISTADLAAATKEGGAKVAALKPTPDPLNEADQKLMMEVAMGGMMQLQLSKLALEKTQDADVKALAKAEVEEQTGLSMKLKEIAAAKKVSLPGEPDAKTKKMLASLEKASGAEFDKMYVKESGVDGHELLQKTMMKVESKATDPLLKKLAATTLPLIKTHLEASKGELAEVGEAKKA